jgi:nucleoside 2-deoxyribosyltransferase
MKIYIAACFAQQAEVRIKADELKALGHECTSRWRYEPSTGGDGSEPEHAAHYADAALCDLEDVNSADTFVLLTSATSRSGGKHVETGYALAREKRVIIVGRRAENVFHWLVAEHYESWDKFLEALCQQQPTNTR